MFVALTGTPGTGKTAVAQVLKQKGYTIADLNDIAFSQHFILGEDEERGSKILDIASINSYLLKSFSDSELVIIDGHASHHLSMVEKIIVLRCHPSTLQKRLGTKQWKEGKIAENVEAEALDVILSEAADAFNEEDIYEIDTTKQTIADVAAVVSDIIVSGFKPIKKYSIGLIDWSEDYFSTST